MLPPRTKP